MRERTNQNMIIMRDLILSVNKYDNVVLATPHCTVSLIDKGKPVFGPFDLLCRMTRVSVCTPFVQIKVRTGTKICCYKNLQTFGPYINKSKTLCHINIYGCVRVFVCILFRFYVHCRKDKNIFRTHSIRILCHSF